jgi:hypothetical protein
VLLHILRIGSGQFVVCLQPHEHCLSADTEVLLQHDNVCGRESPLRRALRFLDLSVQGCLRHEQIRRKQVGLPFLVGLVSKANRTDSGRCVLIEIVVVKLVG